MYWSVLLFAFSLYLYLHALYICICIHFVFVFACTLYLCAGGSVEVRYESNSPNSLQSVLPSWLYLQHHHRCTNTITIAAITITITANTNTITITITANIVANSHFYITSITTNIGAKLMLAICTSFMALFATPSPLHQHHHYHHHHHRQHHYHHI